MHEFITWYRYHWIRLAVQLYWFESNNPTRPIIIYFQRPSKSFDWGMTNELSLIWWWVCQVFSWRDFYNYLSWRDKGALELTRWVSSNNTMIIIMNMKKYTFFLLFKYTYTHFFLFFILPEGDEKLPNFEKYSRSILFCLCVVHLILVPSFLTSKPSSFVPLHLDNGGTHSLLCLSRSLSIQFRPDTIRMQRKRAHGHSSPVHFWWAHILDPG